MAMAMLTLLVSRVHNFWDLLCSSPTFYIGEGNERGEGAPAIDTTCAVFVDRACMVLPSVQS